MNIIKSSCASVVMAAAMSFSQTASAIPILSFIMDGDTAFDPFALINQSTEGERVMRFRLDLAPTGTCFDVTDLPADACPGNAANGLVDFGARGNTDDLVGLWPTYIRDGDTDLEFLFGHFHAGEAFVWDIDVDAIGGGTNGTIYGNQLIGATAWAQFSNGDILSGTLGGVEGNTDASQLLLSGLRLEPTQDPDPDPDPDPDRVPDPDPDPNPVPLPSTLWLLALSMVGLRMRKRKFA